MPPLLAGAILAGLGPTGSDPLVGGWGFTLGIAVGLWCLAILVLAIYGGDDDD